MKNKKQIIWAIILTSAIILFFATGCKPKHIIQERVVTRVDSTAVSNLKNEVRRKDSIIVKLTLQLEASREEIVRLASESSSHIINYDTTAPVNPSTGKYPILQEIVTNTKSQLDKTIKEMESLREEYNKELNSMEQAKTNLELKVEALKVENRELKERITPTTGFNFRLFFWGVGSGMLVFVVILISLRRVRAMLKIGLF